MPYNFPPKMCMITFYMFLPLIILGSHNHKSRIDVYLSGNDSILTYNASKKQNFTFKARLMWIIDNFLVYGMLFGWSTTRRLACSICIEDIRAFTLNHGGKQ